jgi:RNA polymerase sigma factor (sigma-70 family)
VGDADSRDTLERLRRGDPAAFDRVYSTYRAPVFGFLRRLSRRNDVAEDLLQETFLRLARASAGLAEDTNLRAWLFTVARNLYVSHRRWEVLDVSRWLASVDDAQVPSGAPGPEAETESARAIARIEAAINGLSASSREVLILVCIEGLGQEEVAAILGLRYDALRQRLARARAELAEKLAQRREVMA